MYAYQNVYWSNWSSSWNSFFPCKHTVIIMSSLSFTTYWDYFLQLWTSSTIKTIKTDAQIRIFQSLRQNIGCCVGRFTILTTIFMRLRACINPTLFLFDFCDNMVREVTYKSVLGKISDVLVEISARLNATIVVFEHEFRARLRFSKRWA